MRYIEVEWIHDLVDKPYRLVSEIGVDNFERRKIEFFREGKVGYASIESHAGKTMLGTIEVPPLVDINSSDEFDGKSITKQEFERLWLKYVPASS